MSLLNGARQPESPTAAKIPAAASPITPARHQSPPMPRQLHPAAQSAAADYSDALERLETEEAANDQLRADLTVERRHVADLTRLLDAATERADQYQRYSIEVRTHLVHLVSSAKSAHECAMDFAENPPQALPPREADPVETIEEMIADTVAQANGQAAA